MIILHYSTNSLSRTIVYSCIRATAQPRSPHMASGAPRIAFSGFGKPPYTTLLVFPALYPTSRPLSYPAREGILYCEEGANTPSRTHPQTPASPTRVSTMVTGTLHTRFYVYLDSSGFGKPPSRTVLLSG